VGQRKHKLAKRAETIGVAYNGAVRAVQYLFYLQEKIISNMNKAILYQNFHLKNKFICQFNSFLV